MISDRQKRTQHNKDSQEKCFHSYWCIVAYESKKPFTAEVFEFTNGFQILDLEISDYNLKGSLRLPSGAWSLEGTGAFASANFFTTSTLRHNSLVEILTFLLTVILQVFTFRVLLKRFKEFNFSRMSRKDNRKQLLKRFSWCFHIVPNLSSTQ